MPVITAGAVFCATPVRTKEVICGYDVLECANIDEAVKVAAAHPVAAFGKIEVRPFWP
jgi:hypothetical protein